MIVEEIKSQKCLNGQAYIHKTGENQVKVETLYLTHLIVSVYCTMYGIQDHLSFDTQAVYSQIN